MNIPEMLLLGVFGGDSIPEINAVCPAISPTLGAELLANPGFDSDTGWTKGTGWTISGGVGVGTTAPALLYQLVLTAANFYQTSYDLVSRTAGTASGYIGGSLAAKTVPATYTGTFKAANNIAGINGSGGGFSGTVDNPSVKALSVASMISLLGDIYRKNGTYTCAPTLVGDTQCGMVIEYADVNNFVVAYIDRVNGNAILDKRIGGVFSNVVTGGITYSAGKSLQVVVSGANHTLKYNNVQVGSTTAINDAGIGTKVGGFNSLAGNTVGLVTTSPN